MRSREQRIERTVAKRARQLDALRPGWWKRVTQPLDLTSNTQCVLGQVYGNAFYSPFIIRPWIGKFEFVTPWGFSYPTLSGMAIATQCWYDEIQNRRNSQVPDVIPEWMTEQITCA